MEKSITLDLYNGDDLVHRFDVVFPSVNVRQVDDLYVALIKAITLLKEFPL